MWAIAMVCLVAGCGGWTKQDTILEITSAATTAVDGFESRAAVADGIEMNPIMGKHGEHMSVAVYFPLTMAVHAGISALLPHGQIRTAWQVLTTGWELSTDVWNYRCGYTPWR